MRKLLTVILLLSFFLPCGCVQSVSMPEQQEKYTVGVLLKSMNNQHWMDVRIGIQDAAREADAQVIFLYPETESAVKEQRAMFYDLLQRKPDVILFATCDSLNCSPLLAAAREAGIPVMALDTRMVDEQIPYVGADNNYIGMLAAEQLALLMEGGGQVAVVTGVAEQASHIERVDGFSKALEDYPQIEVVSTLNANSDFRLAAECTKQIMGAYPEVRGIFCTSAVMGLGALEQKRRDFYTSAPYIVAVDTQDDALSALKNGGLHGLITQDGYEAGYKGLYCAIELLESGEIADNTYIESILLTRDTVDDYIEKRQIGRREER